MGTAITVAIKANFRSPGIASENEHPLWPCASTSKVLRAGGIIHMMAFAKIIPQAIEGKNSGIVTNIICRSCPFDISRNGTALLWGRYRINLHALNQTRPTITATARNKSKFQGLRRLCARERASEIPVSIFFIALTESSAMVGARQRPGH